MMYTPEYSNTGLVIQGKASSQEFVVLALASSSSGTTSYQKTKFAPYGFRTRRIRYSPDWTPSSEDRSRVILKLNALWVVGVS